MYHNKKKRRIQTSNLLFSKRISKEFFDHDHKTANHYNKRARPAFIFIHGDFFFIFRTFKLYDLFDNVLNTIGK